MWMALLSDADEGEDDGDGDELDDGVDEARSADGNGEGLSVRAIWKSFARC